MAEVPQCALPLNHGNKSIRDEKSRLSILLNFKFFKLKPKIKKVMKPIIDVEIKYVLGLELKGFK